MTANNNPVLRHMFCALFLCLFSVGVFAETKIAILEFELKDMTLRPRIPSEIKRTASIKPLLEAALKTADYIILDVDIKDQKSADSGVGYLFDHHDTAAKLGKNVGADYVIVGRLHKPSFLFSYVMGHLIRVSDSKLIGNYISEAKGPNIKLTIKTVESLAVKIDRDLDKNYTPPPPAKKRNKSNASVAIEGLSEKPLTLAFDDSKLKWGLCPPLFPKGCEISVLHGDLTKPNADIFLKVPANYVIPSHWHNSVERMILVSGEFHIEYTGHSPSVLKPGTYAYGPIKSPHKASCADSGPCILFIAPKSCKPIF